MNHEQTLLLNALNKVVDIACDESLRNIHTESKALATSIFHRLVGNYSVDPYILTIEELQHLAQHNRVPLVKSIRERCSLSLSEALAVTHVFWPREPIG